MNKKEKYLRLKRYWKLKKGFKRNVKIHLVEKKFKTDVLDNVKFQSHIKETAKKLDLPEELVLKVVSHYFMFSLKALLFTRVARLRVLIFSLFRILIQLVLQCHYLKLKLHMLNHKIEKHK